MKPVDIVVLVLACAISTAMVLTAVVPMVLGEPISDARTRFITGLVSAMVGVIAVYVGARVQEGRRNGDDKDA